jgi:hypothetical protein
MINKKLRATAALCTATLATPLIAFFAPGAASAAIVPNQYACSRWTHKCVQSNGKHVNGLPNACYWTWSFYGSGSSTSICNYWE